MNTLFFKYALEVNRTGSITKAAQNLYMAQPNLSKAVRELEESLGYPVFERKSNGMAPTKKGETFLLYAKDILDRINELEKLSNDQKDNIQKFQVAIPRGSYIANGFTEFVSELDMDQKIDLTVRETNSMQAIDFVADEKFNLGIVRYQKVYENYFLDYIKSKQLIYEPVWEFEYLVVMSGKHPLSDKENIKMEDLSNYIEICHGDIEVPYLNIYSIFHHQNETSSEKKIYVYERGSQFDLLTNVPQTFMWVSPIPKRYLKQYGLVQKFCEAGNNNRYKDILIYRKGYRLSNLDIKFQRKLYESKIEVSMDANSLRA